MAGRFSGVGRWIRNHKILSVVLLLLSLPAWEILTIPWWNIINLPSENPTRTSLMRQRIEEAEESQTTLTIRHQWIPLHKLPRHTLDAVIVAEDGTFYSHGGFDWFEVKESINRNLEEGKAVRGASTITQQLAKNLYLSTSKTFLRKMKEALITVALEEHLSKQRILELYLNVIEWGPGIFGIQAASRHYFGKSAADLTLEESLRLAAVIPSPLRYRPDSDRGYVIRRVGLLRDRMIRSGKLKE
ncbi:MAG: monofunctional biosynthetic peptidoglycan transglycosylase [Ignavibacteria bacterium]|nr:monofunctional biosynthetic peptidoglycan transglycosylase [Ignavibacteria bacterium]